MLQVKATLYEVSVLLFKEMALLVQSNVSLVPEAIISYKDEIPLNETVLSFVQVKVSLYQEILNCS